jgi:hypothetical protein
MTSRRTEFARAIPAFVLLFSVSGCVSVGTNYSEAAATQLQPGMTRAEVVRLLGKPNSIVTLSDGREQLGWVHSTGSMFGAKARSLTLPFDQDGRLLQVPGGPAAEGPPAVATTAATRVGGFSSNYEVSTTSTANGSMAPTSTLPPGVTQLGPDIWLYPAPTPSGKCLQAPSDYTGTGSASRPTVSASLPRCRS